MRKAYNLGSVLVFGMVGLVCGAVIFIALSSYVSSRNVFELHARDIMSNIASYTIDKSVQHLQPAKDAAALTSALAVNDVVNRADMTEMETYFYEQLSLYSQFSGIYYANMEGEFIMASRYGSEEVPFYTKIIRKSRDLRTVEIIQRNPMLEEHERYYDLEDEYDPRIRPWFIEASRGRDLIWTDPYIFFTSKNPGITTAIPVFSPEGDMTGVVGVDIEISQLSDFISTLKVGHNGRAFIINSQGSIIAYPDKDKIRHELDDGESLRLTNVSELDDPIGRWAYQKYRDLPQEELLERGNFISFQYEGENYHSMFTPFQVSRWPWTLVIYLPEDDYLGTLKTNRKFNLYFSLFAAMVCSIIGWFITRSITRPMNVLTQAAERVEHKDFASPVDMDSGYWELQVAEKAFESMRLALFKYQNHMEDLVSSRTEELEESNRQLEQTIEELERAQEDLRRARSQAETANNAKSAFLATISHEIRTPLAGILGFAEMIEQNEICETTQTYVTTIIQESNRLSRLINGLLDLAKIEAGELTLERVPLNLEELVRSVVLLVRSKADEKDLQCRFHIAPEVPRIIMGDSLRLSQILLNLMSNAVKFTHRGSVLMELTSEGISARDHRITFNVVDTGIGIDEDRIASIFEEYSQANTNTARLYGGTGLGLPIANRLVQLMGGSLEVNSHPGQGSRFYFTLLVQEEKKEALPPEEHLEQLRERLRGKRVLAAEDSPTNRDILAFHLGKAHSQVDFAENGREAVELFEKESYDLIILDINMPEMNGLEAADVIRAKDPRIPLIALTAHGSQRDVQECLKRGFNDCIIKPYTGKGLIRCLTEWMPNPN